MKVSSFRSICNLQLQLKPRVAFGTMSALSMDNERDTMTNSHKMQIAFRARHMGTNALKIEGIKLATGSKRDQEESHILETEWRRRQGY